MLDQNPTGTAGALSVAALISRIQSDPRFPKHRIAGVLSSLRCLLRWLGRQDALRRAMKPEDVVLTFATIAAAFKTFAPAALRVSRKRLQNAESDIRFALRLYGQAPARTAVSTDEVRWLKGITSSKFVGASLGYLLRFIDAKGIDPWSMSNEHAEGFRAAVLDDPEVRWPRRTARLAISAWNREAARNPEWPQTELTLQSLRTRWGLPWSTFPPTLKAEVDAFFDQEQTDDDLFGVCRRKSAPSTIRAQKDHLRLAATALAKAGVAPAEIGGLRDLCSPERFQTAVRWIRNAKGEMTSTVQNVAGTLAKVGKQAKIMTPDEILKVSEFQKNAYPKYIDRKYPRRDRDQEVLNLLDDGRLMDALLTLGPRLAAKVRASGKRNIRAAIDIQRALAFDLLLSCPLRIKNLVHLDLEKHFYPITIKRCEYTVVSIPAAETKNGEPTEHILLEDTAKRLREYVDVYRPLICAAPSNWLFPGGKRGSAKTENTLGEQLSKWASAELGFPFHVHLMRKIATKLYLDDSPEGIEVMRRKLGHTTDEMIRRYYAQRLHRAAQKKYLEALEGRSLAAFRMAPMKIGKKKGKRNA